MFAIGMSPATDIKAKRVPPRNILINANYAAVGAGEHFPPRCAKKKVLGDNQARLEILRVVCAEEAILQLNCVGLKWQLWDSNTQ